MSVYHNASMKSFHRHSDLDAMEAHLSNRIASYGLVYIASFTVATE